jgi:hypothetical protein
VKYEHRGEPPLPTHHYRRRLLRHGSYAAAALGGSLAVGVAGYHWLGHFGWIDSLLNASMILGGMGPVGDLATDGAKVFASAYALYSGVLCIALAGLLIGPVFHRVLHRFHWEADQAEAHDGRRAARPHAAARPADKRPKSN